MGGFARPCVSGGKGGQQYLGQVANAFGRGSDANGRAGVLLRLGRRFDALEAVVAARGALGA